MWAVTLPQWLDAADLATAAVVVVVGSALAAYTAIRVVRAVVVRVVLVALAAGVGLVVWTQRTELRQCVEERDCGCDILGVEVPLPAADERRCPADI